MCATPKSVSLIATSSRPDSSTLPGFRSQWTTPRACAWASADSTPRTSTCTTDQSSAAVSPSRLPRCMYSITRYGLPSASPVALAAAAPTSPWSNTATIPGCTSPATARTSRWNAAR